MQERKKQFDGVEKVESIEEVIEVKHGNTTFQVVSEYIGDATLEHLIKRLIQQEVENSNFYPVQENPYLSFRK